MRNLRYVLEREILPVVQKPGRYIGGERGAVSKPDAECRIALAFPDVYEIGMSHLGLKILYGAVNADPRLAAERVFAPWPDMEAALRARGVPLYSLESFRPLAEFELIGFSLQHELTYTNILTMLDLAGIGLFSRDRGDAPFPLIIAGGPGTFNPAPLEEFIDLFLIGEAEEALPELMRAAAGWKRARRPGSGKRGLLLHLARSVGGVYAPALYRRVFSRDGALAGFETTEPGIPRKVLRRAVSRLRASLLLKDMPVPNIAVVHDRVAMEVRRGCTRGCRFCQAGMIYRPLRDEAAGELSESAAAALRGTGYEEIALCALSVGDYPGLEPLAGKIMDADSTGPVALSLPSLRPDRLSATLMARLARGHKTGITLAPEAGTEAMRRRINKSCSPAELIGFVDEIRRRGWRMVKLYFMIGLPGEGEDDMRGILETVKAVARAGGKGKWDVNVTVSSFIPKPHTPFQWEPMAPVEELRLKQACLREGMRERNVRLKFHDLESSLLEGVFSRGDRDLGGALYLAWKAGCRFDGWKECFSPVKWREAFRAAGVDPARTAGRRFAPGSCLPWDVVDAGVKTEFLIGEREKALRGETTSDCAGGICAGCGACAALGMKPPRPTATG